jgi:hypothetical protein
VTRDQLNEQWARAIVSCGLAISSVDNEEFRKAVLFSSLCGQQAVSLLPGGGRDTTLHHRTMFTTKHIPELDRKLDAAVMARINGLLEKLGGIILSDGWTSTSNRPILNVLLSVLGYSTLRAAIDSSGSAKTMKYIASLLIKYITEVGPEKIFAVCMDGACKGAFPLIRAKFPWIQCFSCPSHGIDNFIKNVCSSKDEIKMQKNEMGNWEQDVPIKWGVSFFEDCFSQMKEVICFVTGRQLPLARFRAMAAGLLASEKPSCGTEPLFFGETRYGSLVMMGDRLLNTLLIYQKLMVDDEYREWVKVQKKCVRKKVRVF